MLKLSVFMGFFVTVYAALPCRRFLCGMLVGGISGHTECSHCLAGNFYVECGGRLYAAGINAAWINAVGEMRQSTEAAGSIEKK